MKTNLKKDNKGFSLVELIVVIAIMGILAVTLAPRLTSYVEKARKAADQEVINSIYTAVRYGVLDEDIETAAIALASTGYELNSALPVIGEGVYDVTGAVWEFDADSTNVADPLVVEINDIVGEFRLKSSDASAATSIVVTVVDADTVSVELFYDGTISSYIASDAAVRP